MNTKPTSLNWVDPASRPISPAMKTLQERNEVLRVLEELVQVKKWKDKYGKDEQYQRMMPKAWQQAEDILEKYGI